MERPQLRVSDAQKHIGQAEEVKLGSCEPSAAEIPLYDREVALMLV